MKFCVKCISRRIFLIRNINKNNDIYGRNMNDDNKNGNNISVIINNNDNSNNDKNDDNNNTYNIILFLFSYIY